MYLILAQLTETVYFFLPNWTLFLVNLISLFLYLIHLEFSFSQPLSLLSFYLILFFIVFFEIVLKSMRSVFLPQFPCVNITELLLILGFPTDFPFPFKLFVSIGENLILILIKFSFLIL